VRAEDAEDFVHLCNDVAVVKSSRPIENFWLHVKAKELTRLGHITLNLLIPLRITPKKMSSQPGFFRQTLSFPPKTAAMNNSA
jgi:hypothetical protein